MFAELPGGVDLHAGIWELLAGDLQQLRGIRPAPRHRLLRDHRRRLLLRDEAVIHQFILNTTLPSIKMIKRR